MTKDINKVYLSGRLGRDAELRIVPTNGQSVLNFKLASTRPIRQPDGTFKQKVQWSRVTIWGEMADRYAGRLKKGTYLHLEGRLETREWQDQVGQWHELTSVVVIEVYKVLPSARNQAGPDGGSEQQYQEDESGGPNNYSGEPPEAEDFNWAAEEMALAGGEVS